MLIPESDLPLQRREELIIPYTCIVGADGDARHSAYPDAIPYLAPMEEKLVHAPLEENTLRELEARLAPYLLLHGYEREAEDCARVHETLIAPADFFAPPPPLAVRLTATNFSDYENKTDFTFDYSDQIAYATIVEGAIVSLAAENPNSTNKICEIYAETYPDYQNQGLASQNVAALTAEKTRAGLTVVYRCATDNLPSLRIAKRLGFVHYDYFYCHNAYRID